MGLPLYRRWNRALVESGALPRLRRAERALARKKRFVYRDAGKLRVIDLKLRPRVMGAPQLAYLSGVARAVATLQQVVTERWLTEPSLQRALPLSPAEVSFVEPILRSAPAFRAPTVMRLDASVAMRGSQWKSRLKLFELNSVGVGGLALTPIAAEVMVELMLPRLNAPHLRAGPDTRLALLNLFRSYGATLEPRSPAARKAGLTVGLVEERDDDSGVAEYDDLAHYLKRHGVRAVVGDVRALRLEGRNVLLEGRPVDLLYRDTEVKDLVTMRGASAARAALRTAFAEGRVISGVAGDFDHKSLLEVATDPTFSSLLSPAQRKLLGPHALWTRLVYPRRTTDERGKSVELERHLARHRERYVLKPNRSYGGVGVTVGVDTSPADWSRALERALAKPGTWVCQQLGEVMREDFPVVNDDGSVSMLKHFVDCGIYKVGDTFGILSRAAYQRVVNVSSGGGLAVVLFS